MDASDRRSDRGEVERVDFQQIMRAVWLWRWAVLASIAVSLATGFLVTTNMTPVYESTTTLMVGQFLDRERPTPQDLMTGERLAETYAHLVTREAIIEATIQKLGLSVGWRELATRVRAVPQARTQLLEITVADSEAERARRIAEEIAAQLILQSPTGGRLGDEDHRLFVSQQLVRVRTRIASLQDEMELLREERAGAQTVRRIEDLENKIASLEVQLSGLRREYVDLFGLQGDQEQTNYLSVVESPMAALAPSRPNLWLNLLLSGVGGALLALVGVFLWETLDDRFRGAGDVEEHLELPLMGTVATIPNPSARAEGVFPGSSNGRTGEEFRLLRANLAFTRFRERSSMILLTSPGPGEGKTTSVSNLGVAFAGGGKKVLLVDADLRRSRLSQVFGLSSSRGLSTLLADPSLAISDLVLPTAVDNLVLLPAGPAPPNPVELLDSDLMRERLEQLQGLADTILIDGPPVLGLADAPVLAALAQNVLLVIDSNSTRRKAARESREALSRAQSHLLGIILNNYQTGLSSDYYDYTPASGSS